MTRDTCRYVVSTRIRTGRSIVGFPFNPNMTEEQYEKMEVMAKEAFDKMPDDLAGDYYPLTGTLCFNDVCKMIKGANEISRNTILLKVPTIASSQRFYMVGITFTIISGVSRALQQ